MHLLEFGSITWSRNRAAGIGWELYENYLIARDKFHPDYFLYENNKSTFPAIREQITRKLGVDPILINSALVSTQYRQRIYWTNIPGVKQPDDLEIVLRDILEKPVNIDFSRAAMPMQNKPVCVNSKSGRSGVPGLQPSLSHRIYSIEGKATAVTTGFHPSIAIPITSLPASDREETLQMCKPECQGKSTAYEVCNGQAAINGEQYPINLQDGCYLIRKLTIRECMRLQTIPDDYIFHVCSSQAYKMVGNGWTVDVIAHILSFCPGITSEDLDVLSMYDGMSCGRLALNKLGSQISRYFATEIDKHAIETTQCSFLDTIQLGDAFQVRKDGWALPGTK